MGPGVEEHHWRYIRRSIRICTSCGRQECLVGKDWKLVWDPSQQRAELVSGAANPSEGEPPRPGEEN